MSPHCRQLTWARSVSCLYEHNLYAVNITLACRLLTWDWIAGSVGSSHKRVSVGELLVCSYAGMLVRTIGVKGKISAQPQIKPRQFRSDCSNLDLWVMARSRGTIRKLDQEGLHVACVKEGRPGSVAVCQEFRLKSGPIQYTAQCASRQCTSGCFLVWSCVTIPSYKWPSSHYEIFSYLGKSHICDNTVV
jgi:hypothetical protein